VNKDAERDDAAKSNAVIMFQAVSTNMPEVKLLTPAGDRLA
jgi:hypothetical protein